MPLRGHLVLEAVEQHLCLLLSKLRLGRGLLSTSEGRIEYEALLQGESVRNVPRSLFERHSYYNILRNSCLCLV